MISKRPLMYLSLPGIALVLGLMWFRRKKTIHCDTGGNISGTESNEFEQKYVRKLNHTISMPIDCSSDKNSHNDNNKICKSAPIDINPKKSSPAKISDQRIDIDILKLKIQVSEDKSLNSIREQDYESISPIDLPDSVDRKRFSFSFKKTENEPIVIKATTAPKISPKDSFEESKYNENVEDDRSSSIVSPLIDEKNNNNDYITKSDDCTNDGMMTALTNSSSQRKNVLSPPLSLCSVQSTDSGKGSSPPHSEGAPTLIYEFVLPQKLIGQLLGRKGSHIRKMKLQTSANILIKKHPDSNRSKICAIEGTQKEIDAALEMIRQKFPEKRYPKLTLQRVYLTPPLQTIIAPIVSSHLKLHLIEGINNDVSVSALISGGHIFCHQPLHPSFPSLSILQNCMNQSYTFCETPTIDDISNGIVCAGCVQNNWFRIEILTHDNDTQMCLAKYLDYGGYANISYSGLRQIRTDFMTIPFQAIECVLSNLQPSDDEWSIESAEVLNKLTQCLILQAQVTGYTLDGLPEVHLYAHLARNKFLFINKELVARKLALWVENNGDDLIFS